MPALQKPLLLTSSGVPPIMMAGEENTVAETKRTQWHPAFCDALELTLRKSRDQLEYQREYNLSSKPLQVDLLVIRKTGSQPIEEAIGQIFRRHNLFEYKSPGDDLNIDTYYKTVAYGCLYKALAGKRVNEIPAADVTLTIIRQEKPDKLLQQMKEAGNVIRCPYPGIYNLSGPDTMFATQVVAIEELPEGTHVWLKALTRHLTRTNAERLILENREVAGSPRDQRMSDAVMQIAISANFDLFEKLKKEDHVMCDALKELMRPEFEEELAAELKNNTDRVTRDVTNRVTRDVTRRVTQDVTQRVTQDTAVSNIKSLMSRMHWSAREAMDALAIPEEKRESYARLIGEKETPKNV